MNALTNSARCTQKADAFEARLTALIPVGSDGGPLKPEVTRINKAVEKLRQCARDWESIAA